MENLARSQDLFLHQAGEVSLAERRPQMDVEFLQAAPIHVPLQSRVSQSTIHVL